MAKFRLSAFSDEYAKDMGSQIEGLLKNKVKMTELRGVDGINVSDLTTVQAVEIRKKLDTFGISVSAIASPIGKSDIAEDVSVQLDKLKHTMEIATILGTKRIRMFSFYVPAENADACKDEVIERIGKMLEIAEDGDITLCHENEKGIYGDTPARCLTLMTEFEGRLGCVFDPANFLQCGCEPYPTAYTMLLPYITYMHIKDCTRRGVIVPAGQGAGCIPEMLALLNNRFRKQEFILTVEPHLRVFDGLENLENGEQHSQIANTFPSAEKAFEAAVNGTRYCLPRNRE